MAGQLSLPFGVYVSTDEDLDLKYRVANDAAKNACITNLLVKIGYVVYQEDNNTRYVLKAYPTPGSLTGVIWEELSNSQPDGKSYHILRTDNSITAPTIVEVPLPKNGDVAVIKLLNTDVIYWTHDGSTWGTDFSVKSPIAQLSFQIDSVQIKTYHLISKNTVKGILHSLHIFTVGSGSSVNFSLEKHIYSTTTVLVSGLANPATQASILFFTGDLEEGCSLTLTASSITGGPCSLVGTFSYKTEV